MQLSVSTRIARTLLYEHEVGTLLFCFDIGPAEPHAKEKWKPYLDAGALAQVGDALEHSRLAIAKTGDRMGGS
jgi:hypothetical protein